MFNHYYNESLRKLVVAFGSLFNNIYVVREDKNSSEVNRIQIPLTYGPKEKFIRRLQEQSGISDDTKVQLTLPRMGFEISNIDYDPTRHLNKLNKRLITEAGKPTAETFQETPYNVGFSLYAFTRNMDDNLQIIEQILPHFTPDFIVSLNLNSIDYKLDVPIVLSNVSIQEEYEGNFLERRVIASAFNFTCKTRIYSEIKQVPVITGVTIDTSLFVGDNDSKLFKRGINVTGGTSDFIAGDISYYDLSLIHI